MPTRPQKNHKQPSFRAPHFLRQPLFLNMSQILRIILFVSYGALVIHIYRVINTRHEDMELYYVHQPPGVIKRVIREMSKFEFAKIEADYEKPMRLPSDLKYVLKWIEPISHVSPKIFSSGQEYFLKNNCPYHNCYLTTDKSLLRYPGSYDAILFDAENTWHFHPVFRTPEQVFIFFASEPASLYPMCYPGYNYLFNWTWTYKLDSNIVQTFFSVYHTDGTLAGPNIDGKWKTNNKKIAPTVREKISTKKKMVASFVNQCTPKSEEEKLTKSLSKALKAHGHTLDTYGWCGKEECPKQSLNECLKILQTDYYFYLAIENNLCEDFVTHNVLYALEYYTVPIVFGGANYSRFLPLGSYIDASTMTPKRLAALMDLITRTPQMYDSYFRWHQNYYFRENAMDSNLCRLCELLNDPLQQQNVKNFTGWWNTPADVCQYDGKGEDVFYEL